MARNGRLGRFDRSGQLTTSQKGEERLLRQFVNLVIPSRDLRPPM